MTKKTVARAKSSEKKRQNASVKSRKTGTAPKRSAKAESAAVVKATRVALFYRLNSLLHTVRLIAGHEDHLCTLVHEVETHGLPGPELTDDLLALFDEIPAASMYSDDLEAARTVLTSPSKAAQPPSGKRPLRQTTGSR